MIGAHPARIAGLALGVAVTMLLGGCNSADTADSAAKTSDENATPSSGQTAAEPNEPADITEVPDGASLEPGEYVMPLLFGDGSMQAVVHMPAGYFTMTGVDSAVISDGSVQPPHHYGDLAFWAKVDKVDIDPCQDGRVTSAGTTVHDLVAALVNRPHFATSRPVKTSIGGYSGVLLKSTGPRSLAGCDEGLRILGAHTADGVVWLSSFGDKPTHFYHWIINVDGQRIVAGVRIDPESTEHPKELIGIVQSARFVDGDAG